MKHAMSIYPASRPAECGGQATPDTRQAIITALAICRDADMNTRDPLALREVLRDIAWTLRCALEALDSDTMRRARALLEDIQS